MSHVVQAGILFVMEAGLVLLILLALLPVSWDHRHEPKLHCLGILFIFIFSI